MMTMTTTMTVIIIIIIIKEIETACLQQLAYRGWYSRRTFHMRTADWMMVMKRLRYSILFFTTTASNATSALLTLQ